MNTVRLSQPIETGGLNILDIATRVKTQHAWIYARCHSHPDLKPIWSPATSKLAQYFHNEFKYFRLNRGDAINLKSTTLVAIGKPKLTKGQKLLEQQFTVSLTDIFKRLHHIKIRNSIKQVYWKYLNKCLPINKQIPQICPHDNEPDDHSHFILNCKLVGKVIKQSNQLWKDLTKKDSIHTKENTITRRKIRNRTNLQCCHSMDPMDSTQQVDSQRPNHPNTRTHQTQYNIRIEKICTCTNSQCQIKNA